MPSAALMHEQGIGDQFDETWEGEDVVIALAPMLLVEVGEKLVLESEAEDLQNRLGQGESPKGFEEECLVANLDLAGLGVGGKRKVGHDRELRNE